MIQTLIVVLLFTGALVYLGWIITKQLHAKSSCTTGCGKCSIDVNKSEKLQAKIPIAKKAH